MKKLKTGKNISCKTCGKVFYVPLNRLLSGVKYCSRKCKAEYARKNSGATRSCQYCNKEFYARGNPKNRMYCSMECAGKGRQVGRNVKCDWCGKETYKHKIFLIKNKNHFCGVKCANEYQARNKVKYICKICGKEFKWSKSRIKDNNPTYCSWNCRVKDKEHVLWCAIKGNVAQQNKKGLNKLELAGGNILKNMGIEFEEQVLMFGKFLVDVLISDRKLIIQWDGEYWHNKPKRKKLDRSQDAYLEKCGYKVLRFTDKQIKEDKGLVYEDIKRAIQQAA